jgi:AAA domain, putative AbiEii toxin, Type IV TA system
MLERLHLKNVGPAPELEMEFAPRVNLITGDNGLGKSFLLEVGWWALTNNFLITLNSWDRPYLIDTFFCSESTALSSQNTQQGSVNRRLSSDNPLNYSPAPINGIVLHLKPDGKVAWFDSIHNSVRSYMGLTPEGKTFVFDFESQQVWNGLEQNGKVVSNGLIRDWAKWQLENGEAFQQFKAVLAKLSSDETEKLEPGKLTRVSLDDARDIPTLKMPYGQEVPITQASAGIKRVVSLAYMLVWTWQEHLRAAELTRQKPAREIVLLIDELEQHLHPRWQRVILPALLETVKELMKSDVRVQIIATTHSPMVLASLEPLYDDTQDAWFDLNLVDGTVTLERMPWRKRGDASAWLTSEAFDLPSSGSLDREGAMDRAAKVMASPKLTKKSFLEHDQALRGVLGETDPFWIRWRFMGEKKGWL